MSCDQNKMVVQIKANIKQKYSWLTDNEIQTCYKMALGDYVTIKYPSDNNRPKLEDVKFDFFNTDWIYKRMLDILGRAGGISLTSYKENGLSFTYAGSYIDPQLVALITPKASVPR